MGERAQARGPTRAGRGRALRGIPAAVPIDDVVRSADPALEVHDFAVRMAVDEPQTAPDESVEVLSVGDRVGARESGSRTSAIGLAPGELLELCEFMKLNRRVEERLVNLYRQGKVVGGFYRSLGQEAIAVGAAYALGPGDLMAPLIRDLGAVLVRGYSPRECFAQYLGRASGPTRGRDGVIHMGEVEGRGVIGGMGMLGSLVAVLAGCGLGLRMLKRDRVCLTFIGDGGASTSGFHDGLNLAAARSLPLVVVVENNGYAYSTPVAKQTREPDFSKRGPALGCPGTTVDGNDVLAVYAATRAAVERARAGLGPSVIEARTFRMKGHAEHDDASYVPRERFEEWRKKDPIDQYEQWLLAKGITTPRDLEGMAQRIDARLDEDVRWAEASPFPEPASALGGVHAEDLPGDLARNPAPGPAVSEKPSGSKPLHGERMSAPDRARIEQYGTLEGAPLRRGLR